MEALSGTLYPAWRQTLHVTTNLVVAFSDADHARGSCDVQCIGATPDGTVQMVGATYTDDFERRDGSWKIAQRKVRMHYFNAVPGMELSAPE